MLPPGDCDGLYDCLYICGTEDFFSLSTVKHDPRGVIFMFDLK